jgi:nitric oxide dioxygenase
MSEADDAARIRASWARVAAAPDLSAGLFYGRLFQIAPEARPLFREDMDVQGRKLVSFLGFVVDNLDDPEALAPKAVALARRHVGYGVSPGQYAAVGEALLWTLGRALGPDFDPETRSAWARAYGRLTGVMAPASLGGAGADKGADPKV